MTTIERRIKALKMMNTAMEQIDDEELYYDGWLVYGVPDGATEDDYCCIAENDNDFYEILDLFIKLYGGQV